MDQTIIAKQGYKIYFFIFQNKCCIQVTMNQYKPWVSAATYFPHNEPSIFPEYLILHPSLAPLRAIDPI